MIDKCVAGYIQSICAEGSWQIVKDGAKSQQCGGKRMPRWNNRNPQNVSP